jgi:BirA family biotin operon repressor/biotin-[acetyl-CoA-carboxylase] ligase
VVGIGLNVNQTRDDLPEELRGRATSIRQATGRQIDRPALAAAILQQLDAGLPKLLTHFPEIVTQAAERSLLLGRWVEVCAGSSMLQGTATGLDAEGQLLLRTAMGWCIPCSAGEATLQGGV